MAELLAFLACCVFVFFAVRIVRESGISPASFGRGCAARVSLDDLLLCFLCHWSATSVAAHCAQQVRVVEHFPRTHDRGGQRVVNHSDGQ